MSETREQRAARRRSWPGQVASSQAPGQPTTVADRLASMWQLALDGLAARGEDVVELERKDWPGRVVRR